MKNRKITKLTAEEEKYFSRTLHPYAYVIRSWGEGPWDKYLRHLRENSPKER